MAWKDFMYFTRGERNGIKVLIALIVFVLFVPVAMKKFERKKAYDYSRFQESVREFEQSLGQRQASGSADESGSHSGGVESSGEPVRLTPFPFNPNGLPESEWRKTGLPAFVIRTIKNYEQAGGRFRYREDLRRIYMMEEEWYTQLEPFIELPCRVSATVDRQARASDRAGEAVAEPEGISYETGDITSRYNTKHPAIAEKESALPRLIELNSADTVELMRIRGIGQVFSRRITGYRELLGGYTNTAQLLEVYGMDSTRWEQMVPYIEIDTSKIRKIHLGHAGFADLLRHPYIDRNLANALINYRNQHGVPDSVAQIKEVVLVTEEVFERIAPYLETGNR